MKPGLFALISAGCLLFAGCGGGKQTEQESRVVAVGATMTEIVYALGAGDELVAVDTSSYFPAEAHALPKIGYFRDISAEGVLAARPTLVLAAHGAGPDHALDQIERAGVEVVRETDTPSIEAIPATIERIARALGREREGQSIVRDLNRRIDAAAKRRTEFEREPRVVFLMSTTDSGGLNAAGSGTAADVMIQWAGAANLANDVSGYRNISPEALAERQPDVILYASHLDGAPGEVGARLREPWIRTTPAGRNGRTYPIDVGYYLVFGPRALDALNDLMTLIHD